MALLLPSAHLPYSNQLLTILHSNSPHFRRKHGHWLIAAAQERDPLGIGNGLDAGEPVEGRMGVQVVGSHLRQFRRKALVQIPAAQSRPGQNSPSQSPTEQ